MFIFFEKFYPCTYPRTYPRVTHVPTLEKLVEGLAALGIKGILRLPGSWPFSLNVVKTPLMRENGQEPKRSAKKTYQAPQAKQDRATTKK